MRHRCVIGILGADAAATGFGVACRWIGWAALRRRVRTYPRKESTYIRLIPHIPPNSPDSTTIPGRSVESARSTASTKMDSKNYC